MGGASEGDEEMREPSGNLIRSLRAQLGMTQEEFAHAIQVTVSTVNRWENTHAQPSRLAWRAVRSLATARGLDDEVATEPDRSHRRPEMLAARPLPRAASGQHR
jgi:DNA-binding XRE family transcriptional regulator